MVSLRFKSSSVATEFVRIEDPFFADIFKRLGATSSTNEDLAVLMTLVAELPLFTQT